ncbi:MAG TPA: serine/threonine-protein kinase [Kofleriaceae bacterium]|nr:serine/threonine-protein kinase [Kofleriaceae bacterium]
MIGAEIHGYRIERAASEDKGGFGEVYFARHETSGAEAVLKVLKPEMSAHREIVTRFFNEARAAASIRHPGIVAVHNVGYHGDRAYLLMERLSGEDLETRLARGPLSAEVALRFLRQAAGAIGAAHDRQIIHRDLKPANLFVVPDPDVVGGERIKVLDFGIAKLEGAATKTQGIFGTPAYMAPEQCESAAQVDARSDLYALGCILYEMMAGRPPFGHGGLELIAAHLRDEPAPLRSIASHAPAGVERLVSRLLRKKRDERPASCKQLIAEIDEASTAPAQPTPAAPPPAFAATLVVSPTSHAATPPAPYAAVPASTPASSTTLGTAAGDITPKVERGASAKWIAASVVVAAAGGAAIFIATRGGRDQPQLASAANGAAPASAATTAPIAMVDAAAPSLISVDAAVVETAPAAVAAPAEAPAPVLAKPPEKHGPSVKIRLNNVISTQGAWSSKALAIARRVPQAELVKCMQTCVKYCEYEFPMALWWDDSDDKSLGSLAHDAPQCLQDIVMGLPIPPPPPKQGSDDLRNLTLMYKYVK